MKRTLSVSAGGSSGGGRSVSGGTASTARSSTAGDGGPQQPLKGDPSDGPACGFGSGEAPGADDPVVSLSFRSPLAAKSEGTGAAPPALGNLDPFDPRLHLAALKNEQSAFGAVSRSCLALNQWAGGGSGLPSTMAGWTFATRSRRPGYAPPSFCAPRSTQSPLDWPSAPFSSAPRTIPTGAAGSSACKPLRSSLGRSTPAPARGRLVSRR